MPRPFSADGSKVYVAVNQSSFSYGYLCMAAADNLQPQQQHLAAGPAERAGGNRCRMTALPHRRSDPTAMSFTGCSKQISLPTTPAAGCCISTPR